MSDVEVRHESDRSRWTAYVDGTEAGFAEYQLTDELVVFTHTEVHAAFEGQGVGGALARTALDEVAAEGARKVMAVCPFIKGWIDRHPDYAGLQFNAPR
ncbi:MAG: GNAT family N-acetyltransferase [Nocardioides sp.]|nr:GNAT family N-acetyltransferase [Nocardioides sp.]